MRYRAAWHHARGLGLFVACLFVACSCHNQVGKSDASRQDLAMAQDMALLDSSPSVDSASLDGFQPYVPPKCSPQPVPSKVPAGWERFSDWSCNCPFYIPASAAALPKPIEWEPCGGRLPGTGLKCRWMKVDWTSQDRWPGGLYAPVGTNAEAVIDEAGMVRLSFMRIKNEPDQYYLMYLTADADGRIYTALVDASDSDQEGCWIGHDLSNHRVIYDFFGDDLNSDPFRRPQVHGTAGNLLTELRPTVWIKQTGNDLEFDGNDDWLMERDMDHSTITLHPWSDLSQSILASSPRLDLEGIPAIEPQMHGSQIFWSTNSLWYIGENMWDAEHGAHPLVRFLGDTTRGVWDFGTDGKTMVWQQGEGRASDSSGQFPVVSTMTAPYTTDPAQLQPRRLRSESGGINTGQYVIGCGLAAHSDAEDNLVVVRLSDGHGWKVPAQSKIDPEHGWTIPTLDFTKVLAITCDELFVKVETDGVAQIARIRLDSLGPGTPAD